MLLIVIITAFARFNNKLHLKNSLNVLAMTFIQYFKFRQMIIFCGIFLLACNSEEPEAVPAPAPVPGTPAATSTVEELDSLSDHFEFLSVKKISGEIPAAPAGNSSLKISFKDTLYMMGFARIPIEFLHDAATNVAGVYIQVHRPAASTAGDPVYATYHYDVPELAESAGSDTVSVIFVGFDPTGLELPLSLPVTISPYGKNGQPLDEIEEIFTVEKSNDGSNISGRSKSDPCPFTTSSAIDSWNWKYSAIEVNGSLEFYYAKATNATYGQTILGCCNPGLSSTGCAPGVTPTFSLFFPTYYRIELELLAFLDNGTFRRTTVEASANPETDSSDFCSGGFGRVRASIHEIDYRGFWTLDPNTQNLQLRTDTSTDPGGGYGNPGGLLSYTCHLMLLIQVDREGFGRDLQKLYIRGGIRSYQWYSVPD
jgi:hypothetical protein